MFLLIVGHNVRIRVITNRFQHSTETVDRQFKETVRAICRLRKFIIRPSQSNEVHPHIANNTKFFPYFKNALSVWNISSSHCTWFGVNCTSNRTQVQSLSLTSLGLFGNIPPQLSNFTSLKTLILYNNSFFGQIPSEFARLTSLQHIILAQNSISGTIPISLSQCLMLERMSFENNKLTGLLPSELGQLPRLKNFDVSVNNLTGAIPSTFAILSTLTILSIAKTQISGEIPNELGRLHNLVRLQLLDNQLSGEIPFLIFNISSLEFLSLTENRLVGKLPSNIGLTLPNIRELHLGRNSLEGPIPSSLSNTSYIEFLDLPSNNFTGPIPLLATCQLLEKLVLAGTAVNGSIPKQIFELPRLKFLILANNTLSGSLPYEFGHLRQREIMDISGNQLSGYIPTITERYSSLRRLNIARNKITGSLPKLLEYLAAVESLDLSSNNLSGLIPKELLNVHVLETLNLFFNSFERDVPKNGVFAKIRWDSLQGDSRLCAFAHDAAEKLRVNTSVTKKKSNSHLVLKVTIPISAIIVLVYALCLVWALITKKKSKIRNNGTSSSVVKGLPPRLPYSEIQLGTNGFATENLLRKERLECEALRNIRHRNLVKVITSCSSIDHTGAAFKALAMKFMSNATALDYLHHDCDPPVVHCDLKPGNELLEEDMTAHVGNFGLARFLSHNSSQNESITIGLKGSIDYIAPEYGLGGKASTSGDVYSFGILLLEMIIAKKPTNRMFQEGLSLNKFISEVHESKILDIADPRLFRDYESVTRSSSTSCSFGGDNNNNNNNITLRSEECVAAMVGVGLSCVAHSSKECFTMREALSKLQEIKRSFIGS
ncbi:hypothetical protein SO802_013210 [Lithocarpus litseifolius]|uniref:non-specific serine/threonine protein kinase n=1 Tax=Lithocarpus litseifolius TaxID=425828 RepID=A0AAW2D7P9_9ROSI